MGVAHEKLGIVSYIPRVFAVTFSQTGAPMTPMGREDLRLQYKIILSHQHPLLLNSFL